MTDNWDHGASRYQGRRAIGGRISVRRGVFEFAPHVFDRKTGGKPLSIGLGSVRSIERTARSWNPATFSPRRCLQITTTDGTAEKFLVNRLDALIDRLQKAVEQADDRRP
jgi:hypothetical protein